VQRNEKLRKSGANSFKMAATSNMFLYSLTIQPPTTITQAIVGQFSGTKEQQILTASGSRLTLSRPDPSQGRVTTLLSQDVFGIIRSIAAFRLAGSSKGKFTRPRTFLGFT
jgi:splicing factor 3B subunit 3